MRTGIGFRGPVVGLLLLAFALPGDTGCATSRYLNYRTRPDYPRTRDDSLRIPGLREPVQTFLDPSGIPHIQARNEEDLARVTGFFQGRYRFFAMDMLRRLARGRVSELVGEQPLFEGTTVEFDRAMRGWGIDRDIARDVQELSPEMRGLLAAFTEGVNEALRRYRPMEYRVLGIAPEPWTIEDCFAIGRLNAWSVTHNWQQELSRLLLAWHVGLDRAEAIYGHAPWAGGTTLPPSGPPRELPPAVAAELRNLFPSRPPRTAAPRSEAGPVLDPGGLTGASNSWVVAADLSASGRPLQANDPHLTHMLPSLMFQQHLSAPGVDVIGAGIAGLPFVLAGHNGHVAWGTTSLVGDVVDLFVERADPGRPDCVLRDGVPVPLEVREETVRVRRGKVMEERRFRIRVGPHGPLLNDLYPHLLDPEMPLVSLQWDPPGIADSLEAVRKAARATTVGELREALSGMMSPASAWTAADTDGTIAFFVTGAIPVRPRHLGTFPAPGWDSSYDWTGIVNPAALPHAEAREGFFAHANNLVADPARSPVFLHVDTAPSYRYDRIAELIRTTGPHTAQSLADIQMDVRLNRGKRLLPFLVQDLSRREARWSPMERKALDLLRSWDFEAGTGSVGTTLFFSTYREAVILAIQDELPPDAYRFFLSQRYSTNVADLWFDRPDHPVWDDRRTPRVEMRREVVQEAFRRAVRRLQRELGPNPEEWRWGKVHTLQIRHAFGGRKAISRFMNLRPSPVGGALDSVWKSHFDLGNEDHPFAVVAGPSYRQIVDLADIDHGLWVSDTGISGWPGSPQYGDQHEAWKRGEFLPMIFRWDEVRSLARATIRLVPLGRDEEPDPEGPLEDDTPAAAGEEEAP